MLLCLKCLDQNNIDKSKCQIYFDNFKNCKTFWMDVKFARRRLGQLFYQALNNIRIY